MFSPPLLVGREKHAINFSDKGVSYAYVKESPSVFLLNLVIILHYQCNNNWPLVAGITPSVEGPVRICQFMHSIFRFFDDI